LEFKLAAQNKRTLCFIFLITLWHISRFS